MNNLANSEMYRLATNHAGDYAGKYQEEAYDLLDIEEGAWTEDSWADILYDDSKGKLFAVWANGPATSFETECEYREISFDECPEAFREVEEKMEES